MKKMQKVRFGFYLMALIAALPMLFFNQNYTSVSAQPTRSAWRFKNIRVLNEINQYGKVTVERYDQNGGEVEINLRGDSSGLCPGGSETVRFTWRFTNDISQVVSGGSIGVNNEAHQRERNAPCTTHLVNRSSIHITGTNTGASPFSQNEANNMDEVFFKSNEALAYAAGEDGRGQSRAGGVTVKTGAGRSDYPFTFFTFHITTPGGRLVYAYVFELVGSNDTPPGGTNTSSLPGNEMTETTGTPDLSSTPFSANGQEQSTPPPTRIGAYSDSNQTNANANNSSGGNKRSCFGFVILAAVMLSLTLFTGKRTRF